eukprot:767598-Hanusia_phi.AAC.4
MHSWSTNKLVRKVYLIFKMGTTNQNRLKQCWFERDTKTRKVIKSKLLTAWKDLHRSEKPYMKSKLSQGNYAGKRTKFNRPANNGFKNT